MGGTAKSNCKGCGKKEAWVKICGHFLQLPLLCVHNMYTYMKTESMCNYTFCIFHHQIGSKSTLLIQCCEYAGEIKCILVWEGPQKVCRTEEVLNKLVKKKQKENVSSLGNCLNAISPIFWLVLFLLWFLPTFILLVDDTEAFVIGEHLPLGPTSASQQPWELGKVTGLCTSFISST